MTVGIVSWPQLLNFCCGVSLAAAETGLVPVARSSPGIFYNFTAWTGLILASTAFMVNYAEIYK